MCRELRAMEVNTLERVSGEGEQDGIGHGSHAFQGKGGTASISCCRDVKEKAFELTT